MLSQPRVSLITSCYNGKTYLTPFLDSLLTQTYKQVEFFFINDGSRDGTEKIFLSYQPLLEEKGWQVVYHKQENKGVAHALNYGLRRFTGEYLACVDSDDILYPDFLSAKVSFMEQYPHYALCYSGVEIVKEEAPAQVIRRIMRKPQAKDDLFIDCLLGRNEALSAPALTYFYRAKNWLACNTQRQIYEDTPVGQNWQMLLPIVYSGKCGYLNKVLAKYVMRHTSHSHTRKRRSVAEQCRVEKQLLFRILDELHLPSITYNKYKALIEKKYRRKWLAGKLKKVPGLFQVAKRIYQYFKH